MQFQWRHCGTLCSKINVALDWSSQVALRIPVWFYHTENEERRRIRKWRVAAVQHREGIAENDRDVAEALLHELRACGSRLFYCFMIITWKYFLLRISMSSLTLSRSKLPFGHLYILDFSMKLNCNAFMNNVMYVCNNVCEK